MWLGVASSQGPSPWFSASQSLCHERSACNPGKRGKTPKTQHQTGSSVSNRINKPGFMRILALHCQHPPYGFLLPSMLLIIPSTLLKTINPKSLELSHGCSNYQLAKRWFTTQPCLGIHQLKVPNRRRRQGWVSLLSTCTCASSLPVLYALISFSLKSGWNGSAGFVLKFCNWSYKRAPAGNASAIPTLFPQNMTLPASTQNVTKGEKNHANCIPLEKTLGARSGKGLS